jgi:hypothetical protein
VVTINDIVSSVDHPKLYLIEPLAPMIGGISVILKVSRDNPNSIKKG